MRSYKKRKLKDQLMLLTIGTALTAEGNEAGIYQDGGGLTGRDKCRGMLRIYLSRASYVHRKEYKN